VTTHSDPGSHLVGAAEGPPLETTENPVHANLARLAAEFANVSDEFSCSPEESLISEINNVVHPATAAEACLAPTLALLGWAGEGRLIQDPAAFRPRRQCRGAPSRALLIRLRDDQKVSKAIGDQFPRHTMFVHA